MTATTFVTVLESGPLEQQVVLLAQSLRAFGGDAGQADIVAVQPRRDAALSPQTRRVLGGLGVRIVSERLVTEHAWNPHLNKCAAMTWAEDNLRTDFVTWLDGDLVFLRDPGPLLPGDGIGFVARAGEADQGSDGSDGNAAYWQKVSQVVGVDYRASRLIDSIPPDRPIHEYYQSGIYTVRRAEGISHRHWTFFTRMIAARIASRTCGTYHYDQVALAMAARTAAGSRALYPWEMNYNMNPLAIADIDPDMLRRCVVLHYHGSFYPAHYAAIRPFLDHLPDQPRALIERHVPFVNTMRLPARLWRKALALQRGRAAARHKASCTVF